MTTASWEIRLDGVDKRVRAKAAERLLFLEKRGSERLAESQLQQAASPQFCCAVSRREIAGSTT
jgi:hypothetical protein